MGVPLILTMAARDLKLNLRWLVSIQGPTHTITKKDFKSNPQRPVNLSLIHFFPLFTISVPKRNSFMSGEERKWNTAFF